MRSDRDKRTDTEREIDEFLSKFDNPADELSTDIDSYLDDENAANKTPVQTFSWKQVDSPEITKAYKNTAASSSFSSEKTVIVNNNTVKDSSPAEIKVSDNKEESEKLSWVERRRKAKEKKDPVTDGSIPGIRTIRRTCSALNAMPVSIIRSSAAGIF